MKSLYGIFFPSIVLINFNIRCFEIVWIGMEKQWCWTINFNIRCFEIRTAKGCQQTIWDKLQHKMFWNSFAMTLLDFKAIDKLQHKMFWNRNSLQIYKHKLRINFNIRCFEMNCRTESTWQGADKLQHKMFWNANTD